MLIPRRLCLSCAIWRQLVCGRAPRASVQPLAPAKRPKAVCKATLQVTAASFSFSKGWKVERRNLRRNSRGSPSLCGKGGESGLDDRAKARGLGKCRRDAGSKLCSWHSLATSSCTTRWPDNDIRYLYIQLNGHEPEADPRDHHPRIAGFLMTKCEPLAAWSVWECDWDSTNRCILGNR